MKPFLDFIEKIIINILVLLDGNSMRKPTFPIVTLSKKVTSQALSKFEVSAFFLYTEIVT